MNHADIDITFLRRAGKYLRESSNELSLLTRLLVARERYRILEERVANTPAGPMRSIANEKKCEALAIVIDLEKQLKEMA